MKSDGKMILLGMAMVILFALYAFGACLVLVLIPFAVSNPDVIDPMTALVAGLGYGSAVTFMQSIVLLGWQYFYRKFFDALKGKAPPKE